MKIRSIIDWPVYIKKYISEDYLKKNWKNCINNSANPPSKATCEL